MFVYVLDNLGRPLMPCKASKARKLLKLNKAKVKKMTPFTIQLVNPSSCYKQDVTLGIDTGSKHIGVSATTYSQELFACELTLRDDIVDNLSKRRMLRRSRRNRKTRYRKARFNNRGNTRTEGRLMPSAKQRLNSHIQLVLKVSKILPISKIVVETASFDIQKIKNPQISGTQYQEGEQLGFSNIREYVLARDNHVCQCCKGKSKDSILEVHHIETRKVGGNAPNNLVTVCRTCHQKHHDKNDSLTFKFKRGQVFRDASAVSQMRKMVFKELKTIFPDIPIYNTYGYITKYNRIKSNLPKQHAVDALVITGNLNVKPLGYFYKGKQNRNHYRQLHEMLPKKGAIRPPVILPKFIYGYQISDKVLCNGKVGFISSRRQSGSFAVKDINGDFIRRNITYKKLKLIEQRTSLMFAVVSR